MCLAGRLPGGRGWDGGEGLIFNNLFINNLRWCRTRLTHVSCLLNHGWKQSVKFAFGYATQPVTGSVPLNTDRGFMYSEKINPGLLLLTGVESQKLKHNNIQEPVSSADRGPCRGLWPRPLQMPMEYLPTQQDILLARKPTKGIHEYDFQIKNVPFKMVDVGGQRSERRRWFECFDSVTSILFLVSSSEYDQVLMEDRQTNRLMESLNIFETIVNNRVFSNVSIILFLNKTDLLEEKVKTVAIKDYFPEYQGEPHCLADVQKFLVECFRSKRRDQQQKPLYHHFTTAINTENIRLVFRDVKDTILHDNLKQLMLQ
ncbi:hypothetical protein JZ751_013095 [Albula glossodonta]|uniref:Guanine nucleotide-binding protein subunit alpha-13 n=1 Tax=Albula glossodonta TaxID=121402 RepID=A0A8T2P4Y5_9TELE|nr:hypothetical protein JZ751_013095 [Albula glossodonta]